MTVLKKLMAFCPGPRILIMNGRIQYIKQLSGSCILMTYLYKESFSNPLSEPIIGVKCYLFLDQRNICPVPHPQHIYK